MACLQQRDRNFKTDAGNKHLRLGTGSVSSISPLNPMEKSRSCYKYLQYQHTVLYVSQDELYVQYFKKILQEHISSFDF